MNRYAGHLLLAIIIAASLAACASAKRIADPPPNASPQSPTESSDSTDPGSTEFGITPLGHRPDADTTTPDNTNVEQTPNATLTRHLIDATGHPNARCNDGTTPVFYHRPGTGSGADKWIIWFKGGGQCSSKAECAAREQELTSAQPWMDSSRETLSVTSGADGIFNPDPGKNPDFYNWHHVYLVYCTSDAWIGTAGPNPQLGNLQFRGHYVVNAVIDALARKTVVGERTLRDATDILLAGSAVGGAGIRQHIDRLAAKCHWATVRAVNDAALVPDPVDILGDRYPQFAQQLSNAALQTRQTQYAVWRPMLDASCLALHADDPYRCIDSTYLVAAGHISTPMFIHQDQRDYTLLESIPSSATLEQRELFAILIAEAIRELLDGWSGAFSPNVGLHTMLTTERFYTQRVDGQSMATVLGNWYFGRAGVKSVIAPAQP